MTRLIDADTLKEGIAELKRSPWYNDGLIPSWQAGIKEAFEVVELLCINKAPTIDAEPVRHGKWIIEDGHVCCSECGEISKEYNWCPYCGARMDEADDE